MSRHDILQQACKDLHFDQDIAVEKTKELKAKAETNIFGDFDDIHFAQTYMFIRSDRELRVTWIEEYDTVQFQLEDQMARQDMVIKRAVASLLEDSRLHTKGKFLMLCAFGTSSEFAKMYEEDAVCGRRWQEWIRREIGKRLPQFKNDYLEDVFDCPEDEIDIMDEDGWVDDGKWRND